MLLNSISYGTSNFESKKRGGVFRLFFYFELNGAPPTILRLQFLHADKHRDLMERVLVYLLKANSVSMKNQPPLLLSS